MPIASLLAGSIRRGVFKRHGEDLHARKAPRSGKPVERHETLDLPRPFQTPEMRLCGPEIAPVATFPPALPSRMDHRPIRLASLESQFATVPLGAALDGWARRFGKSHKPTKSVPAKPAHHGDAGWEDRFSDPRRPKAASRRGEAPRGGAFLLLGLARWVKARWCERSYPQPRLVLKYGFSDVLRIFRHARKGAEILAFLAEICLGVNQL